MPLIIEMLPYAQHPEASSILGQIMEKGASALSKKGDPLTLMLLLLLLATVFVAAAVLFWVGVPLCRSDCLAWNSLSWDSDGSWQVPSRPPFQI